MSGRLFTPAVDVNPTAAVVNFGTPTVELFLGPAGQFIQYHDVADLDVLIRLASDARHMLLTAQTGVHTERPKVVCLCGSTRFLKAFREANLRLTLAGQIVLSIGCDTKSDADLGIIAGDLAPAKAALDELHKRKIDLADYVYVLNVGGYIGKSTRGEIEYALAHGKPVEYLEPPPQDVSRPDADAGQTTAEGVAPAGPGHSDGLEPLPPLPQRAEPHDCPPCQFDNHDECYADDGRVCTCNERGHAGEAVAKTEATP